MANGSELKDDAAQALRAAGYKPCPRWWLTQEQMDLVWYMARQNQSDVTRIRVEVKRRSMLTEEERKKEDIERAWKKMKAGEGNT